MEIPELPNELTSMVEPEMVSSQSRSAQAAVISLASSWLLSFLSSFNNTYMVTERLLVPNPRLTESSVAPTLSTSSNAVSRLMTSSDMVMVSSSRASSGMVRETDIW